MDFVAPLPANLGVAQRLGAAKGIAGTTAVAYTTIPTKTKYLKLRTRTYTTAVVTQVGFIPYLSVYKTVDAAATFTDYSTAANDTDNATDVVASSLDTAANGDYIYVGAGHKFGGITVDVDSTNGNNAVMTAEIWNGIAWVAQTITDGTASGGKTFAVDGDITWTTSALWTKSIIAGTNGSSLYWIRFKVDAALDSSTTANSFIALPQAVVEFAQDETQIFPITYGVGAWKGFSVIADAGTTFVLATVYAGGGEFD